MHLQRAADTLVRDAGGYTDNFLSGVFGGVFGGAEIKKAKEKEREREKEEKKGKEKEGEEEKGEEDGLEEKLPGGVLEKSLEWRGEYARLLCAQAAHRERAQQWRPARNLYEAALAVPLPVEGVHQYADVWVAAAARAAAIAEWEGDVANAHRMLANAVVDASPPLHPPFSSSSSSSSSDSGVDKNTDTGMVVGKGIGMDWVTARKASPPEITPAMLPPADDMEANTAPLLAAVSELAIFLARHGELTPALDLLGRVLLARRAHASSSLFPSSSPLSTPQPQTSTTTDITTTTTTTATRSRKRTDPRAFSTSPGDACAIATTTAAIGELLWALGKRADGVAWEQKAFDDTRGLADYRRACKDCALVAAENLVRMGEVMAREGSGEVDGKGWFGTRKRKDEKKEGEKREEEEKREGERLREVYEQRLEEVRDIRAVRDAHRAAEHASFF